MIPLLDSLVDTAGCPLELTSIVEKFLENAVVEVRAESQASHRRRCP